MIDDIYVSVSFQLEAAIELLEILVKKSSWNNPIIFHCFQSKLFG